MGRKIPWILVVAALALQLNASGALAAAAALTPLATDDNVPGVPLSASGFSTSLDSPTNTDNVYRVWLEQGETFSANMWVTSGTAGFAPEILLYAPSTPDIWGSRVDYLVISQQPTFPRSIAYTAPASGVYYLDLYQNVEIPASGVVSVSWSVSHPVYRFYNSSAGTHFYTASEVEKASVIANLSSMYHYEGIAYTTNPYRNGAPLYRFYRPSSGTHFYTADEAEKDRIRSTMSNIYSYEGPAYSVSLYPPPGALTVWRFYRPSSGTHFYTADPAECNNVIATLGSIYKYEGPAFYIVQ